MAEVPLELIFQMLKGLDERMDAMQRQIIDLQRQVTGLTSDMAEVKSELRLLRSDNMAFRGYLDALTRDNFRNVNMIDRTRQDIADLRVRLDRVEARLGEADLPPH